MRVRVGRNQQTHTHTRYSMQTYHHTNTHTHTGLLRARSLKLRPNEDLLHVTATTSSQLAMDRSHRIRWKTLQAYTSARRQRHCRNVRQ